MLKLLAFDLDDTLYPEKSYIRGGFRAVSTYMQQMHNIDANKFYKKLVKTKNLEPSVKVFDNALSQYHLLDQRLIKKLIKKYRDQPLHLKLFPGVRFLLIELKKKYALALITDGSHIVQYKKLVHLKIADYFGTILYTHDLGIDFLKPSELPFREILDTNAVLPQEALYIGNNPYKDFVGAKKIGIKTVRVNQGIYQGKNADEMLNADFTIKNLKELPAVISFLEKHKK